MLLEFIGRSVRRNDMEPPTQKKSKQAPHTLPFILSSPPAGRPTSTVEDSVVLRPTRVDLSEPTPTAQEPIADHAPSSSPCLPFPAASVRPTHPNGGVRFGEASNPGPVRTRASLIHSHDDSDADSDDTLTANCPSTPSPPLTPVRSTSMLDRLPQARRTTPSRTISIPARYNSPPSPEPSPSKRRGQGRPRSRSTGTNSFVVEAILDSRTAYGRNNEPPGMNLTGFSIWLVGMAIPMPLTNGSMIPVCSTTLPCSATGTMLTLANPVAPLLCPLLLLHPQMLSPITHDQLHPLVVDLQTSPAPLSHSVR
jgi:hypothetical protein